MPPGRAGNSLIHSFAHRSFAHLFILHKSNERSWAIRLDPSKQMSDWANRSGRSRQMSNRERINQVTHDKWATVSDSLRSLIINERLSDLLKKCLLKNLKSYFLYVLNRFFYLKNERFAHSFFFGEQCERIAHQKWANERIARIFEGIAHSLMFSQKKERFAQKTDERIPSPTSRDQMTHQNKKTTNKTIVE